ncbi:GntR family transcriptional regulator [Nonomuraea sp. NPDC046570]|uniref:GntR family transcriptional regulator n=1 Tax=Nonomuraea sp. NPDC046570 TaxID=3155255 RepID=UPI003401440E
MKQHNDQPAYLRIADDLRTRIRAGDPPAGGLLPSDSALMRAYGVARGTARQAVAELEQLGLVVSEMGKGRRVVGVGLGDRGPATSRYEVVAESLRDDIAAGGFERGSRLPREADLAEQFNVSKGTARQALQMLAAEGLVTPVHGKGWFVGGEQDALTRTGEVAEAVRRAILSGEYANGSRLPGESTLAERLGVARVTVRRAIALLEAEGIVETRRGLGRVVIHTTRD